MEAQAQAAPRDIRGLLPCEMGDSTWGSRNKHLMPLSDDRKNAETLCKP